MPLRSLHVLVADDAPEIGAMVAIALRRFGHQVTTCRDGAEAVALSRTEAYDVIILDHCMPVMDGLTAARLIREAPATRHVPLVSISASGGEERARALDVFDCYLPKPLSPRELVHTVERLGDRQIVS
jgi:CheY-like chemotaxis protein